jgi:hypothetical protein
VVDNEQPHQSGTGNLPDVPEQPPAGVDPETFRQFQEFQRFQQFQHFTQTTPPAAPPWTAEGGNLEPAPGRPDVHEQLAGVRDQLHKIQHSQAKIERVTNPPLWRKILRSTPVRWAMGILLLIILAVWGVPALIQHYFGSNVDQHTNGAGKPSSIGVSGLLPGAPYDTVAAVYLLPAQGSPASRTCLLFSPTAAKTFAQAFGAASCEAAVGKITAQITDRNAYATPDMSMLPNPTGDTVTVSSCAFDVTGGPRLGTFTVTKQEDGWLVTGYQAQQPCTSSVPTTGPGQPTATTTPGLPTEQPIPTGGFSGIPVS